MKEYSARVMSSANEPPKPIGEIIDRLEQLGEELFILQKSLEKTESIEHTLLGAGHQNSK
jgi:hypothetical protein